MGTKVIAGVVLGACVARSASAQCASEWSGRFSAIALEAADGYPWVHAQVVHDDGSGPALFIGGNFQDAGGVTVNAIARWDGHGFAALGTGMFSAMYTHPSVDSLASWDPDGPGPLPAVLVAAGEFDHAGGAPALGIAIWDGLRWSALPPIPVGISYSSVSLVSVLHADANAPRLCALVSFLAGGPELYVATQAWMWDGVAWTDGTGLNGVVGSIEFFAPGVASGVPPALYALSAWHFAAHSYCSDSDSLSRLAPPAWMTLLSGGCTSYDDCAHSTCSGQFPRGIAVFDPDGPAPQLIAAGGFTGAGSATFHNLAAFDGVNWSAFAGDGDGVSSVFALRDPATSRPSVYALGNNFTVGGVPALNLARYDSTGWTAIPYGMQGGASSMVSFSAPGQLPAIYVGGPTVTGVSVPGWGRLTSVGWAPIGECLNNEVHALSVYAAPGEAPALYAGGTFTAAAGQLAVSLAKWDGVRWSPAANLNNHVDCMTPYGPYLALGGKFNLGSLGVGLYDGHAVRPLGTGMNNYVHALAMFNGALYAGGQFTSAGGVNAASIARWNGSAWSAVGSGVNNHVDALTVFDGGSGAKLYAGGKFTAAGGVAAAHLARWDGAAWSAVPGGGADG
jgi:hypothetical protein